MNARVSLPFLALVLALGHPARADHPTLSFEDGSPGPVTTISAIPMPAGVASAGVQSQFIFTNEIPDADLIRYTLLDDHVHSTESLTSVSLNSAYGVTDDFTAGFALPYIWRTGFRSVGFAPAPAGGGGAGSPVKAPRHGDHEHGGGSGAPNQPALVPYIESTDFEGVGDATFYGQYRFLHDGAALRHAALITGLKTPTGSTDVRDARGALIEGDHQPGSGSWDPLVGLSLTQQVGKWSFDLSGLYSFVTEGTRQTDRGDIVNYNAALSYRVLGGSGEDACDHEGHSHAHTPTEVAAPHDHLDKSPTTWDLILEANGDWREMVRIGGVAEENTGGNVIFLAAGSRLALPSGWVTSLSIGIPAVNDLNGIQSEPALRMLFGISRGF